MDRPSSSSTRPVASKTVRQRFWLAKEGEPSYPSLTSAANIKLYGCTLTVFINISLSRTYEVPPSPEYKNRAAAKEAAIRLALRERVLDLLTPAGFDPSAPPLTAAAASRLARAARGREPMDVDSQGGSSGASEGAAIAAEPVDVPARSPQVKDAVSRLDEFVQDWVGPGCLPQYDIFRDERSEPSPLPLDTPSLLADPEFRFRWPLRRQLVYPFRFWNGARRFRGSVQQTRAELVEDDELFRHLGLAHASPATLCPKRPRRRHRPIHAGAYSTPQ